MWQYTLKITDPMSIEIDQVSFRWQGFEYLKRKSKAFFLVVIMKRY